MLLQEPHDDGLLVSLGLSLSSPFSASCCAPAPACLPLSQSPFSPWPLAVTRQHRAHITSVLHAAVRLGRSCPELRTAASSGQKRESERKGWTAEMTLQRRRRRRWQRVLAGRRSFWPAGSFTETTTSAVVRPVSHAGVGKSGYPSPADRHGACRCCVRPSDGRADKLSLTAIPLAGTRVVGAVSPREAENFPLLSSRRSRCADPRPTARSDPVCTTS